MHRIVDTTQLTDRIAALVIDAPEIASGAAPGQLVMTRLKGWVRPIPLAITDLDKIKGTVTIVIRTPEVILDGENLFDIRNAPGQRADGREGSVVATSETIEITGPIGRVEPLETANKVLCAAEGLGIPTILPRLQEFKERGCYTLVAVGYPSKNELFWVERMDQYSDELYVITDDGSFGIRGPVRRVLSGICDQTGDVDRVLAAGPVAFLRGVAEVTRKHKIATTVTLGAALDRVDGGPQTDSPAETPTSRSADEFDWNQKIDLDGHSVDFGDLVWKLGIQVPK
jgi:ferredoxin--NADP+ reductase